jgi:outer membrane receptor protein involved in Fe transport
MLGGYYEDGSITNHVPVLTSTLYPFLATLNNDAQAHIQITTYSAFGQLRWKIVPKLELAAGLRWTDEVRTEDAFSFVTQKAIPVADPRIKSDTNSPEFDLTYKPTGDLTFFAAYKQGYKSGSFNIATAPAPGDNNAYGDEKSEGGEFGMKSLLLDRQLLFDAAAYYYHLIGLQESIGQSNAAGVAVVRTVNAASARTYGLDIDAAYRSATIVGLTINGALNWNRANYLTYNNLPCWQGQTVAAGCNQALNPATRLYQNQDASGGALVRAPEWQFNAGFSYEFPVGAHTKMVFSSGNMFSSTYKTTPDIGRPNSDNYQRSYVKADLGLALQASDNSWEIALIGKNINDEVTTGRCIFANFANGLVFGGLITGGTTEGPAGVSEAQCYSDPGREVWLRLTLRVVGSRG